jgi:hypothetical protein
MELWLTKNGAISAPGNEEARYGRRFAPFQNIAVSRGLDYASYRQTADKL